MDGQLYRLQEQASDQFDFSKFHLFLGILVALFKLSYQQLDSI
jgi:hypothetical protein